MRRSLLTLFLLLPVLLAAQLGVHPPKADWKLLRTPEGRVLYPEGYEARAQRIANLMHAMRERHAATVGEQHYTFDLVLQSPNTTINGYVGLAPFRSEFFLTPPQQPNLLSNADWADLLAIHEFRHVQQVSNERRGVTRLASILFGQLGWAGFAALNPNWYAEGDAVVMETALTPSGRGRTPAFSATLRSLLDQDIRYRYARARNNSLKRNVPDHYRYGYNTILYARERFGDDVWVDVFQGGAAYRGLFYAFSRNLRKATGLGTKGMYRAALDDLAERQEQDLATRGTFVEGSPIPTRPRAVTDYRYPSVDGLGRTLALRAGFQHTPALVQFTEDGREREIVPVGIQREPYVHVNGGFATWMEDRNHPRYTNEGFSDVFVYNLADGVKRRLSFQRKYFSPAVSNSGDELVAVEHDVFSDRLNLVILSVYNGEVRETIPLEANSAALPRFSPDGGTIYYYERTFAGTAIVAYDRDTRKKTALRPPSTEAYGHLSVAADGGLIYGSGRDGIDNVYRLDPVTSAVRQLTNVRIGAEYPFEAEDGTLYYTEATPEGMRPRVLRPATKAAGGVPDELRPAAPNPFERPEAYASEMFDLTANVPVTEYASEDVGNTYGVRLHSWNAVGNAVAPGVGIAASNALNTVTLDATARYNINEKRAFYTAQASYGGLFPVLTGALTYSERNFNTTVVTDTALLRRSAQFDQVAVSLGASTPLSWTAGEFRTFLSPSVGVSRLVLGADRVGELPDNITSLRTAAVFSLLQRRARQQVQSRLGLQLRLDFQRTLGEGDLGQSLRFESRLYLPGLHRTHSFRAEFSHQSEDSRNPYQYVDQFRYSRGYTVSFADQVRRISLDYEFPLWHPDIGIFGIWYLQRIRLNPFYDQGTFSITRLDDQTMRSAGVEVFLDQVLLNTGGVTIGFRWSYLLSDTVFGNESGSSVFGTVFSQSF